MKKIKAFWKSQRPAFKQMLLFILTSSIIYPLAVISEKLNLLQPDIKDILCVAAIYFITATILDLVRKELDRE